MTAATPPSPRLPDSRRPWAGIALFAILIGTFIPAQPTQAWNDTGHMIAALIAFDLLEESVRDEALRLIRAHPRFEADFTRAMPEYIRDGTEKNQARWIFSRAATWPDIARGLDGDEGKKYHRPTWHYINLPLFLNKADETALKPDLKVNLDLDVGEHPDESKLNVIQALKWCSRIVGDKAKPAGDRGVHLSWLLHMTGDLHQPLHAATLFTRKKFGDRDGDKGGNEVPVALKGNLHKLWDGLLGTSEHLGTVSGKARKLALDPALKSGGAEAAKDTLFQNWMKESYDLAIDHAYDDTVRSAVAETERGGSLGAISLPEDYLEVAGGVAKEQIVKAGHRLAALITRLLK
jgi:hypothetical protein